MASAEAAPSLGPRYAPDDPTLPKPWLGLIDGSSGVQYYWNPETNVTQYERPASIPPPLPAGAPPVGSTPKLAPIPGARTMQPNGAEAQQGQQMTQVPQQQGQQMSQLPQQLTSQQQGPFVPQSSNPQVSQAAQQALPNQQGTQLGQAMPQQIRQQMVHHSGQQPNPQLAQQPGQQMPQQSIQQMPQQQAPQYQGPEMAQQQAHQQYMSYQQSMLPQGQQGMQQQNQHSGQGQSFPNQQEYKAAYQKREEVDFQQGNQIGFSPSQFQQNVPGGTNSVHMQQMGGHPSHFQQFGGPSINAQQPASVVKMQPSGTDMVHQQHAPRFQNQPGMGLMQSQQSNLPSVGRTGNEYYLNAGKEGPVMGAQQPKLTTIPPTRNQQEMRPGGVPFQNAAPAHAGGMNAVAGHTMHTMYNHSSNGPSFPGNAVIRPPFMGSSDVSNLSPVEVYRQQHEVTATGENVPPPYMTFEDTGFPPEILRDIHAAGFSCPTPIQAQTWPIALQSRDIVAIAKTGSGKTLGYLMPAFMLLRQRHNNSRNGPTVLVLAPTRELATQIQDEALKFGRSSNVSCTCLYGGAQKGPQLRELERGADIVVATPGRLNDILEMKRINLGQISLFVLDEADRMLDMGFEPQIRQIMKEIPPRRQTLMYTATWPKEVRKIAADLLVHPVQVNIGSVDELAANKSITQYVEVVQQMEKQRRLEQILRAQERGSKVIIFCSTKRLCDQLARSIGRNFGAAAIHGDKSQGERDWVLNQFRSGKTPILVATDVAARGLDIKDIRVVINYDFPTGVEDYVHRIGRTGRAGATGVAYTFLGEGDGKHAADLIKVLEGANQLVPPEVREMASRGPGYGKDRGGMNRFDSGGGGGRWDSGGRGGMRDDSFGGRGGMRDGGGFGGRGGMRDGGFGGRGGVRDGGNFGGRGGMRDGGFGGRGGGRSDFFSGRGNRGRGFGSPSGGGGGPGGWDRNERGLHDRHNMDGRGRGRGRFDNRRETSGRSSRGRSVSSSPERVRTWGYSRSRSRSRSRSWSRSRSRSWSRSRSRSRSPTRGRSRSRSPTRGRCRSRSPTRVRTERRRETNFDKMAPAASEFEAPATTGFAVPPAAEVEAPPAMPLEATHEIANSGGDEPHVEKVAVVSETIHPEGGGEESHVTADP